MTLESLFATPAALPVVPKVVQQLIEGFRREDVAVGDLAAQLATDPVLTAKTLRLANSAYFHVSRQIATLDDALRMLGFTMVRNLVLGCGVAGSFKGTHGMDLPRFWRHALNTAVAARWLAQAADDDAERAFTVGLMHGMGQLLMHEALPGPSAELDAECDPLEGRRAALERERIGFDHAAVGAELARRWNFPEEICRAMRSVPAPLEAEPGSPLAALIHIAAWRARVDVLGFDAEAAAATCPVAVGRSIGLPLAWRADEATLAVGPAIAAQPMPPLAELGNGLEAMFE